MSDGVGRGTTVATKRIDDHLPVGTAISPGHPGNGVRWFRTERGWIDQRGRTVAEDINWYDTIGHGGYWLLTSDGQ